MKAKQAKTEAELIATVANLQDAAACLIFAERARAAGMPALVAACEERAKALRALKPLRLSGVRFTAAHSGRVPREPMITHTAAEQTLTILIAQYNAKLPPTTYGELARRCGFERDKSIRWFGQVTDLIDAACALAGVPSFALVRVHKADGHHVNEDAWQKQYSHLRDQIIARALNGKWTDEDFTKMRDALAVFSANRLGNKRAWKHVWEQIDMEAWAAGPTRMSS
jgi:hypothetical protein